MRLRAGVLGLVALVAALAVLVSGSEFSQAESRVGSYTADNMVASELVPVVSSGTQFRRVTYHYDSAGRKTCQYTELVAPNPPARTDCPADSGSQTFTYYADDRLATQTGRSGSGTITSTYDGNGNPIGVQQGQSVTSTFYLNDLPRTVAQVDGAHSSNYTYNGAGQRAARADVAAATTRTTYAYNNAGYPQSMTSDVDAATTSFAYDHAGRLTQQSVPGFSQNLAYDTDNSLSSFTVLAGSTTVASYSYAVDPNFQLTRQDYTGAGLSGHFGYGYNAEHRLTSLTLGTNTPIAISWDRNGNRLSYGTASSWTYNPDNSIASASGVPYSYHSFGGLKSDGTQSYCYDGFDRLQKQFPVATVDCTTGVPNVSFGYDGLDRQVSRADATSSTNLIPDGLGRVISVKTTSGTDTLAELGPMGQHSALAIPSVGVRYLVGDGQGSIGSILTAAGGSDCAIRYDPFGNPLPATAITTNSVAPSTNPCASGSTVNDFLYRDQRRDQSSGNYQLGARTYDPTKSSFLQPDSYRTGPSGLNLSIGVDPLTLNRYTYVNGDPINLVDPNGHAATAVCFGGDEDTPSCSGGSRTQVVHGDWANYSAGAGTAGGCTSWCWGDAWHALTGGVASIRPDASQLNAANIRDSLVGLLDAAAAAPIDLACMGGPLVSAGCSAFNVQGNTQHLVSGLILAGGGTVNTQSAAYSYGGVGFAVGSVVAGGWGVVRSAPTLAQAGMAVVRSSAAAEGLTPAEQAAQVGLRPIGGGAPNTLADESAQLLAEAQAGEGVPIIGAGTRSVLNDASRLAGDYGGDPYAWAKMTTRAYRLGDGRAIQVHWYQNLDTGFATEFKTKLIGPWFQP